MKTDFHKLQNDVKTRSELLENITITRTSYQDASEIIRIVSETFDVPEREALRQLLYSQADLDNSVKLIDSRDGKIYGILIFSLYKITVGSPILHTNARLIGEYMENFSQVNGYAFVIDERLRGTKLDKEMLKFNQAFLNQFDFVWCAVDKKLPTHNYWKKIGFEDVFEIVDAIFYVKGTHEKGMKDIFILKTVSKFQ